MHDSQKSNSDDISHILIGDCFRYLVATQAAMFLTYAVFHVELRGIFQIIQFLCARKGVILFKNGTIFCLTPVELVGHNIFVKHTIFHMSKFMKLLKKYIFRREIVKSCPYPP